MKPRTIPPLMASRAKSVLLQIGQEETGQKMLRVAECWAADNTAPEPEYMHELHRFLSCEYGFRVKNILPAKRGFYGETWNVQTENGKYFVKIDYWNHHQKELQSNLPIIRYMTDSGISFIPKIIETKDCHLYSCFRQGTFVVFEHIPGELSEDYSTAQLYDHLAKIYRLKTDGLKLKAENFSTKRIDTFLALQRLPEMHTEVKTALAKKEPDIFRYIEHLRQFSAVCKDCKENFHITHGDAGGNCILHGDQLLLVDWDSIMLAPIERDAWIYICDKNEIKIINSILAENGIDHVLEQNRLCYYCYDFFFHYLNEYLKSIIEAENEGQRKAIIQSLIGYLTDCWIYKRLQTADALC